MRVLLTNIPSYFMMVATGWVAGPKRKSAFEMGSKELESPT